jgi:hypothetical protein
MKFGLLYFEAGLEPTIYILQICHFSHSSMSQTPKTLCHGTRFEALGELSRLAKFLTLANTFSEFCYAVPLRAQPDRVLIGLMARSPGTFFLN